MGKFTVTKTDGNLGRRNTSADMVSGLVMGGVATGSLQLDTVSPKLTSLKAAEDLGIDAAYDSTNKILVWYHIKEFFRMNPDGELYIMLVSQKTSTTGVSLTEMCDKSNSYVQKLINDTNGEIHYYGVVLNPDGTYSSTLSGGFDADVSTALTKAQELGVQAFNDKRAVFGFIEGREFNGTVASMADQRANDEEYRVAVNMQDPNVADDDALFVNYAAVGTALGCASRANAHEDIGWTDKFNLQDKISGDFLDVYTTDNNPASDIQASYDDMNTKGVLFARKYTGQAGVFINAFVTGAALTSDYAYGPEVIVINKAARLIYDALFPRVNGPLRINPDNGQIATEVAKAMEADGLQALDVMIETEMSGADVYVDPTQDVLSTGKIVVKFKVVPFGTGREIEAEIGLAKSLS